MFCDDIYPHLEYDNDRLMLSQAQKFILTRGFCEVANQLGQSFEECAALKHLFRLPHNNMWIEFGFATPKPVAVILQKADAETEALLQGRAGYQQLNCKNALSITRILGSYDNALSWVALPQSLRIKPNGNLGMTLTLFDTTVRQEQIDSLVTESIAYCMYLATLNSRTIVEMETVNGENHNPKSAASGKRTLFEHRVLHIKPEIKHMMREAEASDSEEHEGVRAHWRRGHFKVRKTGVFWWSPHVAGRSDLGQVEKKYVA